MISQKKSRQRQRSQQRSQQKVKDKEVKDKEVKDKEVNKKSTKKSTKGNRQRSQRQRSQRQRSHRQRSQRQRSQQRQSRTKVTSSEQERANEEVLQMEEYHQARAPKPLAKVNPLNNDPVLRNIIRKFLYGPGHKTEEQLEEEEEELLHKLNQFKTEYKEIEKHHPYDDHLFQWGKIYTNTRELHTFDTQKDQIKKILQFKNKNIKAFTDILNKKKEQQLLTKRGLYKGDVIQDEGGIQEDSILEDDNILLFYESFDYLTNPEEYERKLSDLYDPDLGTNDNYWTRLSKHHQKLPPTLLPVTEEDNESVYGKEEDLRYYHPQKKVDEMVLHYNIHTETLPQIKENIKYYEGKLERFYMLERLYQNDDGLTIYLCNKIKQFALADQKLYLDKEFKDKYITPCSDNKLLTKIYINTFNTTPHPLKNYFLEGSVRKEIMRGDGEIILLPHSITDILDKVPNKYLSEWAKIDVFHFITDVLELPEDLQLLSRHFSENKNLESFLDKIEDHLTKVVYFDKDAVELGFNFVIDDYTSESIGWTKEKLQEKQEQYRFVKLTEEQINSGVASWLKIDTTEMSDEEVSRINKTLHHHDFDIEKTKRYLILLLMGLVQNESFKQANHYNLSRLVESMQRIIEEDLGIEAELSFPHVFPIHLDESTYQQALEEVLAYNPPLKDEKSIELYLRKKMSFQLYKDYYDLYKHFDNILPKEETDSSDGFIDLDFL